MISLLLRVAAVVCFALAAAGMNTGKVALLPLGLALWCGSTLVPM
jgi:hypothetical protein